MSILSRAFMLQRESQMSRKQKIELIKEQDASYTREKTEIKNDKQKANTYKFILAKKFKNNPILIQNVQTRVSLIIQKKPNL